MYANISWNVLVIMLFINFILLFHGQIFVKVYTHNVQSLYPYCAMCKLYLIYLQIFAHYY